MFQVGTRYDLTMLEVGNGRVETYGWLVLEADGPVIKVAREDETKLINTASSAFVSAEKSKNQSGERPVIEFANFPDAGADAG